MATKNIYDVFGMICKVTACVSPFVRPNNIATKIKTQFCCNEARFLLRPIAYLQMVVDLKVINAENAILSIKCYFLYSISYDQQ